MQDRRPGYTPVYVLDLSNYHITEVTTQSEMPGWISNHEASCDSTGVITIRGGEVTQERNGEQRLCRNFEDYALDPKTWIWRRLTDRNWLEFRIQPTENVFVGKYFRKPEELFPTRAEKLLPREPHSDIRFLVAGVAVSLTFKVLDVEVIVEGHIQEMLLGQLLDEIRAKVESRLGQRCLMQQM